MGKIIKDDFLEALESANGEKRSKKKKETIPSLVTPHSLRSVVDDTVRWKQVEKEAKAERANCEEQIIEWAYEVQENKGFDGSFSKSYYIPGNKTRVTYVTANRWSIGPFGIDHLKDLLGKRFDEFIETQVNVSIKEEVFQDAMLRKRLMAFIPKERFKDFFVTETVYKAVDDFDVKRFSLPRKIWDKMKNIVKQSKPSIR